MFFRAIIAVIFSNHSSKTYLPLYVNNAQLLIRSLFLVISQVSYSIQLKKITVKIFVICDTFLQLRSIASTALFFAKRLLNTAQHFLCSHFYLFLLTVAQSADRRSSRQKNENLGYSTEHQFKCISTI